MMGGGNKARKRNLDEVFTRSERDIRTSSERDLDEFQIRSVRSGCDLDEIIITTFPEKKYVTMRFNPVIADKEDVQGEMTRISGKLHGVTLAKCKDYTELATNPPEVLSEVILNLYQLLERTLVLVSPLDEGEVRGMERWEVAGLVREELRLVLREKTAPPGTLLFIL